VHRILEDGRKAAFEILKQHRDQLEQMAQELIKKETLEDDEIRTMFGFPKRVSLEF